MKRSQELRELRSQKETALQAILTKMADESRAAYTDDEREKSLVLRNEITDLTQQIADQEALEARDAEQAAAAPAIAGGNPASGGEKREQAEIVAKYRFIDAIRSVTNGGNKEGLILEMHQQAAEEARGFGKAVQGIGVPAFFMSEQRDSTVSSTASAGTTVDTNLTGFIGPLRPTPKVVSLGAQMLVGLTSNVDIPRQTAAMASTWEGETDENAEDQPTFDRVSLSPKRLGVVTEVSKQLLIQSSLGMERLLRNDLRIAQELGIDRAAINGSGVAPIPTGILNTSGVNTVAGGTDGAAITRAHLIQLIREVETDDALIENMAFLTNPEVKAKLMSTLLDAGSGRFVLDNANSDLIGYRSAYSTQVPNDLTKGDGTDLSAILFGDFNQLLIGQWGGLDLVADPYTKATSAMVRIVVNSWYDVAVRQPKAFAVMKDIVTTI